MDQDMLNNVPGNNNWKDRLEDADSFTTPVLQNKQAAWNKLHSRLQRKDKRRFIWYSIAAASLLLLIVSALLFPTKQQSISIDTASKKQPDPNKQAVIIAKENRIAISTVVNKEVSPVQHDQVKKLSDEIHSEYSHEKVTMPEMISSRLDTVLVKSISQPAAIQETIPESTTVQMLAKTTPPVKKALKVVHVNELGDPSEVPGQQRVISDYSVIQIGFINRQTYHSVPIPANNIGVNISTGKNSPSN